MCAPIVGGNPNKIVIVSSPAVMARSFAEVSVWMRLQFEYFFLFWFGQKLKRLLSTRMREGRTESELIIIIIVRRALLSGWPKANSWKLLHCLCLILEHVNYSECRSVGGMQLASYSISRFLMSHFVAYGSVGGVKERATEQSKVA